MTLKYIFIILLVMHLPLSAHCLHFVIGHLIGSLALLYLCGVTLEHVSYLRDLGVFVSSDLKPGIHCSSIAAKAYSRCSLLLRGFQTSDVIILLRVFKTYVKPLLESNTPVWNPWLFYTEHIEGVQCYNTSNL